MSSAYVLKGFKTEGTENTGKRKLLRRYEVLPPATKVRYNMLL